MTTTILLVEDDFDTLHPLAELLRLKSFEVYTASDAEKALSLAREKAPGLIITDIVLPGKSGLHFISTIRKDQALGATPIIVMSGCGPMILVEAESAGADLCMEKPINIEKFFAALQQILTRQQAPEPVALPVAPEEKARPLAGEIDRLVDELRKCSSKGEREDVLRRLKEYILAAQARNTFYA